MFKDLYCASIYHLQGWHWPMVQQNLTLLRQLKCSVAGQQIWRGAKSATSDREGAWSKFKFRSISPTCAKWSLTGWGSSLKNIACSALPACWGLCIIPLSVLWLRGRHKALPEERGKRGNSTADVFSSICTTDPC